MDNILKKKKKNTIDIIIVFFLVPESPRYLYSKREYSKLKDCLIKISQINNTYSPALIDKHINKLAIIAELEFKRINN